MTWTRLGLPVVAGFSTHPHWDHLLWHPRFGDAPRYATAGNAHLASQARERAQAMAAESATGVPLELIGLVTPLPADGGPVPGTIIEHQAHAIGHAAVVLADRGVLLAGDMLSDALIPLFDPRQTDQLSAYEAALDRLDEAARHVDVVVPGHGAVAVGPEVAARLRGRPCLHRRVTARRGTGRRASGSRLALRPAPVEPTAGPTRDRMNLGTHRSEVGRHVGEPAVVALEGDRDGVGGAVAVLGDDEVGLALAGDSRSYSASRWSRITMSASCSMLLWTAMPLAMKLCVPEDGGVIDLFDAVGLDGHDRVPQHVVDRQELEVGIVEDRGNTAEPLARRGVLPHRRAAVLAVPMAAWNCAVGHPCSTMAP